MANEIKVNASIQYEDARGFTDEASVTDRKQSVTTKRPVHLIQNVGTSEEAINLGDTSSPCYAFFKNLDPTNFVELRVATGGAKFAKLRPDTTQDGKGGVALLELGSGAQVPYAIADTAACDVEIFLCPL